MQLKQSFNEKSENEKLYHTLINCRAASLGCYGSKDVLSNFRGPQGKSLLIGCIEENKEEKFQYLLRTFGPWFPKLYEADHDGYTPLDWAVKESRFEFIKPLAYMSSSLGISSLFVSIVKEDENSIPLISALKLLKLDVAENILERGVCQQTLQNALTWTWNLKYQAGIQLLLAYGANPTTDLPLLGEKVINSLIHIDATRHYFNGKLYLKVVQEYGNATCGYKSNELLKMLCLHPNQDRIHWQLQVLFDCGMPAYDLIDFNILSPNNINMLRGKVGSLYILSRSAVRAALGLGVSSKVQRMKSLNLIPHIVADDITLKSLAF